MSSDNSPHKLRSLWLSQKPESIPLSLDELLDASKKLTRKVFWRNAREYMAAVVVIAAYGYFFYEFHTFLLRLGSGLTVAGVFLVVFQLRKRGSANSMAKEIDAKSCLEFHRAELVRQRDLHATVWKWYLLPFLPGLSIFFLGQVQLTLSQPGAAARQGSIVLGFGVIFAFCAGVFALVGRLNQSKARKLQARIDAIDALKLPPS